ncbi:hypothetical protein [Haloferula rosea]|uniref:Uncharacterized protein n=1 Tax=Haloferula rosea TaxID=490093 RepID=A0A934VCY4_9BACT|nr:hypothetical protein [Haloferula rosea]MBK1828933.1 hypothetical protein [Haloferula rosea]
MTAASPRSRLAWVVWVTASLAVSYLAGRFLTGGRQMGGRQMGEPVDGGIPPSMVRVEDGRRLVGDGPGWEASTAVGRTRGMLDLIDQCVDAQDFSALIARIDSKADKSERQRFLAMVFDRWLDVDPEAALSEVGQVEVLRHDSARVADTFFQWGSRDPSAAAILLSRMLDGRQLDLESRPPFLDGVDPPVFLLSVIAGLSQSDPRLAAATLQGAADSPARTSGIEVLLQDWYVAEAEEVHEWAASIDDGDSRRLAVELVATEAGQSDVPMAGVAWAMDLPADERQIAIKALADQWSDRNAREAFDWLAGLPDEPLKFEAMPAVLRNLTVVDPGAAADWLNQYKASPAMDASVAAYAKSIRFVNPSAALGSTESITDVELRKQVVALIKRDLARDSAQPAGSD